MVRKHIFFSGWVQGVGFRYRALYAARAMGLTGWVQNLWDGRVEMEVQGEPEKIERLVARLKEGTFIVIDTMTMADVPLKEGEREFRVFS